MEPILIIVLVVVAILNLMLFFKIWGMTNNTKHILNFLLVKSGYEKKLSYENPADTTLKVTFVKKEKLKEELEEKQK